MTNEVLKLDENGSVQLKNLNDMKAYANGLVSSGMLPKSYTRPEQVVAAFQMASELGLKPGIKALSKIANINGTPQLFAEGPLALCQASGLLEDFEGFYFDSKQKRICFDNKNLDQKKEGYYFKVKRKGASHFYEDTYTITEAKASGLGNVWVKFPDDMVRHRTIAKVLKVAFADVLMGVAIAEYDSNTFVMPGGSYEQTRESDLNERFEESPAAQLAEEMKNGTVKFENAPEKEKTVAADFKAIADKAATAEGKDWPSVDEFVEKGGVKLATPTPDEYIIPIGKNKGKVLAKLPLDEAFAMIPGIKAYVAKNPSDLVAKEMLDVVTDYCEGSF